jgi:hypothetical protein
MPEAQNALDKSKARKLSRKKQVTELEDLRAWLLRLGMVAKPTVHVNGTAHSMAVITVDFGTPLDEQTKLTSEQNAELMTRMRSLTKVMHTADVNVRVQNDLSNGIWWASV